MSKNINAPGGRRGIIAAAVTGTLAVTGIVLILVAVFGGGGSVPPQPPPSAAATDVATPNTSGPSTGTGTARPAQQGNPQAVTTSAATQALSRSEPVRLDIPAIGVHTRQITGLGLQPGGKIEVPEKWNTVGWYEGGPAPGQFGPAVMGGHVDSESGPAVFFRLGELRPGDEVKVRRADGKTAVFTVYSIEQHPKTDFPTRRVYTPVHDRPELRLVTCGGTFNESTGHHRANVVVFAKLTTVR